MPGGRMARCMGCGGPISDQYILRVAPDMEWHAACLKCQECHQYLDETCTCFVREGKTYCKRDYSKLFGAKCYGCGNNFNRSHDLVMRAKEKIFHTNCFKCAQCEKALKPGDEFAFRGDYLICRNDYDESVKDDDEMIDANSNNSCDVQLAEEPELASDDSHSRPSTADSSACSILRDIRSPPSVRSPEEHHKKPLVHRSGRINKDAKPTRVRTVLSEKQLMTLKNGYNANPRPDALMKEQLVEMTGLSARVVRVWFQNKRCKDKKRALFVKQNYLNQDKNSRYGNYGSMQGVPLVASPPSQQDQSNGGFEVTSYQAPWSRLADFVSSQELDRLDQSTPQYQHMIQQMQGGYSEMGESSGLYSGSFLEDRGGMSLHPYMNGPHQFKTEISSPD